MKWRLLAIILVAVLLQLLLIGGSYAAEEKTAADADKLQPEKIDKTAKEEKADDKGAKTEEETREPEFIGFVDKDKNGINDKFRDADGDGINDVTKKKYEHRFKFVDKNENKINDVFRDIDGDGVNDLNTKFVDEDEDGINDNVLDCDKDGVNDITGLKYDKDNLMGYRYGIVEEEMRRIYRNFVDENGDGMHDAIARRCGFVDEVKNGTHDLFIDKNGDGICDGRQIGGHRFRFGSGGMMGGRRMRMRRR